MKFLVPNYSCLQNPWLGGYHPQIPILSVLCPQLNLLNPPLNKIPGYATDSTQEKNRTQKSQLLWNASKEMQNEVKEIRNPSFYNWYRTNKDCKPNIFLGEYCFQGLISALTSQPLLLIQAFENTSFYDFILSLMTVIIKTQNINLCMEDTQNCLIYVI